MLPPGASASVGRRLPGSDNLAKDGLGGTEKINVDTRKLRSQYIC